MNKYEKSNEISAFRTSDTSITWKFGLWSQLSIKVFLIIKNVTREKLSF